MTLRVRRQDKISVLTIDRPDAKNAIDEALAVAVEDALTAAARDEAVHAIVLASTGDVFLSGGDLKALSQLPRDAGGAQAVIALGVRIAAIERCPLPVIAAVHGPVFGGGCELVVMTDFSVMDRRASLSFVHRKMGLVPAWGGCTRLTERVGTARANDILLTARTVSATEAVAMGIVNRLAPPGTALSLALAVADELARSPREALVESKRSLVAVREARRGDALEREQKVFRAAWGSPPHLAAMKRFLDR